MKLRLVRTSSGKKGTFGVLSLSNEPLCTTCEDPWDGNVIGRSCIPAGNYLVMSHSGPKYKNVWQILNVPGRSAILIHNGNSINDTQGCILVGNGFGMFGNLPCVINSKSSLERLQEMLPDEFDLEIIDAS